MDPGEVETVNSGSNAAVPVQIEVEASARAQHEEEQGAKVTATAAAMKSEPEAVITVTDSAMMKTMQASEESQGASAKKQPPPVGKKKAPAPVPKAKVPPPVAGKKASVPATLKKVPPPVVVKLDDTTESVASEGLKRRETSSSSLEGGKKAAALAWCQAMVEGSSVNITNFTKSFADGLAFCALMNGILGEAQFSMAGRTSADRASNFEAAFKAAEDVGQERFLDVEDCVSMPDGLDAQSVMTYIFALMKKFPQRR